jgi:hypothetical protein
MKSLYKVLFTIELLHDYYNGAACHDLEVVASSKTVEVLKNGNMLCRQFGNRLVVLIKAHDTGKPVVDLASEKFVFYVKLKDRRFMTVTNVDQLRFHTHRFYFSNLTDNNSAGVLNLSSPIHAYDRLQRYVPGQLVNNADHIFECIKATSGSDTSDTSVWLAKGKIQYATGQDMLRLIGRIGNFAVDSEASAFDIKIYGVNPDNNQYDRLVQEDTIIADKTEKTKQLQVNMLNLLGGRYFVKINGQPITIYVDDVAVHHKIVGVVEIFSLPGVASSFALLDEEGYIKELTYTIRFLNRRAFWKYLTPKNSVKNLRVPGSSPAIYPFNSFSSEGVAAPARKDYFVSKQPIALSEAISQGNFEIELLSNAGGDFPIAPKPDPAAAGMLSYTGDDYYCTIFLNY